MYLIKGLKDRLKILLLYSISFPVSCFNAVFPSHGISQSHLLCFQLGRMHIHTATSNSTYFSLNVIARVYKFIYSTTFEVEGNPFKCRSHIQLSANLISQKSSNRKQAMLEPCISRD